MRKLVLASVLVMSGCVVTDKIDFVEPPGLTESGSCMCAVCWNQPFCQDEASGATQPQSAGTCPAGFQPSVPASRLLFTDTRLTGFECIPPMGRNVDFNAVACPPTEPARAQVEFVDPCIDVPLCARDGAMFAQCEERRGASNPACPQVSTGQRRKACGAGKGATGKANARQKLADQCGVFGLDVPNGAQPARFCFLSCIDELESCSGANNAPSSAVCAGNCDPGTFNPPQVTPNSLLLTAATGTIVINTPNGPTVINTGLDARVAIEASPSCLGPNPVINCAATVQSVYVFAGGPYAMQGETFRNLIATNNEPLPATYSKNSGPVGILTVSAAPGDVYVSADIDGFKRIGEATAAGPVSFWDFDFSARTWSGSVASTILNGTGTVVVTFDGELPNLSPVSNAGPDQVAECTGPNGAQVALSGAQSDDPDGSSDIVAYAWNLRLGGSPFLIERDGVNIVAQLPIGSHYAELLVKDTDGVTDVDGAAIVVQDTTPPTLVPGPDQAREVCTAAVQSQAVAAPAVGDTCGSATVVGQVTATDGVPLAVPIPVVAGAVQVGLGDHTIRWTATDDFGNTAMATQHLRVTLDATPPSISVGNLTQNVCEPMPHTVTLPVPTLGDNCPAPPSASASLLSVNGRALPSPLPISGTPSLPVGTSVIRWTAQDGVGNTASADQTVVIAQSQTAATCCSPGMTVINGTGFSDLLWLPWPGEVCVFGQNGNDSIATGPGADVLVGGAGIDTLSAGFAGDVCLGGASSDIINLFVSGTTAYGEAGADAINIYGDGVAYGNAGDDTIVGILGAQEIHPGPGRDTVQAGSGDDTVYIDDVCEVSALELLDGGLGYDTLYTPVPLSELAARGAIVVGFENVVVTTARSYLSECF